MHTGRNLLNCLTNWFLLVIYTGVRLLVLVLFALTESFESYDGLWLIIIAFALIEFVNCFPTLRQAARLKNAAPSIAQPYVRFSYAILLTVSDLAVAVIFSYGTVAARETILLHPLWLLFTFYEWLVAFAAFVLTKRMIVLLRHSSGMHAMSGIPSAGSPA